MDITGNMATRHGAHPMHTHYVRPELLTARNYSLRSLPATPALQAHLSLSTTSLTPPIFHHNTVRSNI